jgi:transketolase
MPLADLAGKLKQFGLQTYCCDGHQCPELLKAFSWARASAGGPKAVIANTVKGKGISFMEGKSAWHGKPVLAEDYRLAKQELAAGSCFEEGVGHASC